MPSLKEHFQLLARYNAATNRKMYALVQTLSDDQRTEDSGSFFESVHGILNHVVVSDITWLNRFEAWNTESRVLADPVLHPENLSFQHDLCTTFDDLDSVRVRVDELMARWVDELSENRYPETLHYRDSRGSERSYVVWMALDHMFNHQTHHRGQVSHILDSMHIENDYSNIVSIL